MSTAREELEASREKLESLRSQLQQNQKDVRSAGSSENRTPTNELKLEQNHSSVQSEKSQSS